MFQWHVAAMTDPGCQRTDNQDGFYISPDNRVFAVCDGMGSKLSGSRASQLAVATVESTWQTKPPHSTDMTAIRDWITTTISSANEAIHISAKEDPASHGMGTTIVLAVQSPNRSIEIGHVGDSRAYLFRKKPEGEFESFMLTEDHSEIQAGSGAGHNPYRNMITRCLGQAAQVSIDHTTIKLSNKDWIILCTDGLSMVLLDEQIAQIIHKTSDPQKACKDLIEQTHEGGAPDNTTVIAIHYSSDNDDEPPTAPVPLNPKPNQKGTEIAKSLSGNDAENP